MARILLYKTKSLINSSGGAEKIIVSYANEFSKRGHDVILATRDAKKGEPFFKVDNSVTFVRLNFPFSLMRRFVGGLLSLLRLVDKFPSFNYERFVSYELMAYCEQEKPDIVILCGTREMIDFASYGEVDCPLVMMTHSHPKQFFSPKKVQRYRNYLNKIDVIQVLLPSFVSAVPTVYNGKVVCIGNPVHPSPTKEAGDDIIVYVARASKSKQQHKLIEAFAKIAAKHPRWQVHLYGCTNERRYVAKCHRLIKTLGLDSRVFFKGTTSSVLSVYQNSEICAFPSAYEGFGLAMTEAMSLGMPVVGFDYCSAVNEIIQNGVNGFLVKDVDEFAQKLDLLIADGALRKTLGNQARHMAEVYSPDNIMDQWEALINEAVQASTRLN